MGTEFDLCCSIGKKRHAESESSVPVICSLLACGRDTSRPYMFAASRPYMLHYHMESWIMGTDFLIRFPFLIASWARRSR